MSDSIQWIIDDLQRLANPKVVDYKIAKYNTRAENTFGIKHKDLNLLAKVIEKKKM